MSPNKQGYYDGPKYTRDGENKRLILNKAIAFKKTWDDFKQGIEVTAPTELNDTNAWPVIENLYKDKEKVKWGKLMENYGLDLFFCTESEVQDFLVNELFESDRNVSKKTYLNGICSDIRGFFRAIGREHGIGDGQVYEHMTENYIMTGNPMTTGTQEILVKKLKEKGAKTGDSINKDKMGSPVSAIGGYICMMFHLANLMEKVKRWEMKELKQAANLENLANLIIMYAFLLHEGTRPGDVQNHLEHENLYFPLHKKVYWLTLVFLKPDTLRYLVKENKIPRFYEGLFKGKDKKVILGRVKAMMPAEYNSIDLPMIYIICIKIMLSIGVNLKKKVFKDGLNITSLRYRLNKDTLFDQLTCYSFRYGAAEDDFKGQIDPRWTRRRMGHTKNSDMKDQYANNREKRVLFDCEPIPLGMDNYTEVTDSNIIKIEFIDVSVSGCTYDTNWLDNAFKQESNDSNKFKYTDEELHSFKQDFIDTDEKITKFIEGVPNANGSDADGSDTDGSDTDNIEYEIENEWYKSIPLGFNFTWQSKMIPNKLKEVYDESQKILQEFFENVETPNIMPEIWSFPQIQYGNWRGLVNLNDDDIVKLTSQQEVPTSNKRKLSSISAAGPSKSAGGPSKGLTDEDIITFETIEPNNHVVILCLVPDKWSLKVPNIESDKYVWIAKAETCTVLKSGIRANFSGKFMFNNTKELDKPLQIDNKSQTIQIKETSIIKVYEDEELTLNNSDIDDIVEWIKVYT